MSAIEVTFPVGAETKVDDGRGLLTNSRMACAKACLRRHFYAYELGIRKERGSPALRIGSAFHLGQELHGKGKTPEEAIAEVLHTYAVIPAWAEPREWVIEGETVARLLSAYFSYYVNDAFEIVATEQTFDLPILNPATGAEGKIFRLGGKLDKIIKLEDGRLALMEYKTSGRDIGPDTDYWKRLRIDHQISLYVHAARRLGYDVQTVLYDVTRKPGLKPYRATPEHERKYTQVKLNKDGSVKEPSRLYANCRESDETAQEFGDRFSADIAERPEWYFQRREVPRLETDLAEFEQELWEQQKSLRDCQNRNAWPRNTNSCLSPVTCDFWEVCSQGLNPAERLPEGFVKVGYVHAELEGE